MNIKELSEYLGHYDPGFTLQMYTHMLPSSYDRARQAVDRWLERLGLRLTEQGRTALGTTSLTSVRDCLDGSRQAAPDPLRISLFQLGRRLAEESAGDDELLDLLGAFEDVEDLPGTCEGGSATTANPPSDLQVHTHPFSVVIGVCQRPTEQ